MRFRCQRHRSAGALSQCTVDEAPLAIVARAEGLPAGGASPAIDGPFRMTLLRMQCAAPAVETPCWRARRCYCSVVGPCISPSDFPPAELAIHSPAHAEAQPQSEEEQQLGPPALKRPMPGTWRSAASLPSSARMRVRAHSRVNTAQSRPICPKCPYPFAPRRRPGRGRARSRFARSFSSGAQPSDDGMASCRIALMSP